MSALILQYKNQNGNLTNEQEENIIEKVLLLIKQCGKKLNYKSKQLKVKCICQPRCGVENMKYEVRFTTEDKVVAKILKLTYKKITSLMISLQNEKERRLMLTDDFIIAREICSPIKSKNGDNMKALFTEEIVN